jgi:hypothetical protein
MPLDNTKAEDVVTFIQSWHKYAVGDGPSTAFRFTDEKKFDVEGYGKLLKSLGFVFEIGEGKVLSVFL